MRQGAIVLDSGNAGELSEFYRKFLKWERSEQVFEGEQWFIVTDPAGKGLPLVFQQDDHYRPPVWPSAPGEQQQMIHLDFYVEQEEMAQAVAHALSCGAKLAASQLSEHWRVFIDLAGHPFCIIPIPPEVH